MWKMAQINIFSPIKNSKFILKINQSSYLATTTIISCATSWAFLEFTKISPNFSANSIAEPGPTEVINLPETTTLNTKKDEQFSYK
jgi:hypothetical protein